MLKFTQLTDKLTYVPKFRASLMTAHSAVISYVADHFRNIQSFKNQVVKVINTLTYQLYTDGNFAADWDALDPLKLTCSLDDTTLRSGCNSTFVHSKDIEWDLVESSVQDASISTEPAVSAMSSVSTTVQFGSETPKSDLYLKPPVLPRFDVNRVWFKREAFGCIYCIYMSLPEIPTKQNEISVTTDVSRMTDTQLLKLYPNQLIRTRPAAMYDATATLTVDPQLGAVLPISGYTDEELRSNLIKYPHFFRMQKHVDDQLENFYSTIEIDGELYRTLDVWDQLPDTANIPKTAEFMREYVIRRYLLERDHHQVQHRYKIYGELPPFLTLFAPAATYVDWGFTDVVKLARECVLARVAYKQSHNPILRRFANA